MSDDGGGNRVSHQVNGVELTLSDQAATPIPANSLLTPGTFKPFNDNTDPNEFVPNHADPFFAPAPTTPSSATALGVQRPGPQGDVEPLRGRRRTRSAHPRAPGSPQRLVHRHHQR